LDSEGIAEGLERAEVAVLGGDLDDRVLAAPHLRWVHCDHSGLNRSARPEVFERGLTVTGSAGRSAPALAQHAFFLTLALTFDVKVLLEHQARHRWGGIPGYEDRTALWGKTLGIVGLGHTGRAMASLGKAFGMHVMALRRRTEDPPIEVDRLLATDAGDRLDPLLEESDVVMLATQLTDETRHLISTAELRRMKPTALLINMARGAVVDQDALIHALQTDQIAGAGLDTTDPEPLPDDSPLWDLPNVVITPHMTPKLPDRTQRSIDVIVENIERYRRGEPLLNALTPRDRYTGG
jgi:phosphoglycerate dehydrogenase-like enzyme